MDNKQTYIAPAIEVIEMELESTSCVTMSANAVQDAGISNEEGSKNNFWGD